MAGTLERNTSAAVPEGEMSSVETLSPSLISTGARSVASTGAPARDLLDVRALEHLDARRLGRRRRRHEAGHRGREGGRVVPLGRGAARCADR